MQSTSLYLKFSIIISKTIHISEQDFNEWDAGPFSKSEADLYKAEHLRSPYMFIYTSTTSRVVNSQQQLNCNNIKLACSSWVPQSSEDGYPRAGSKRQRNFLIKVKFYGCGWKMTKIGSDKKYKPVQPQVLTLAEQSFVHVGFCAGVSRCGHVRNIYR